MMEASVWLRRLSPVQTLDGEPSTALRNVNTFKLPDGAVVWVSAQQADYRFHRDSNAEENLPLVLLPSAGPGAWFLNDSTLLPWPGSLSCGPLVNGAVQEVLPPGALYPDEKIWYKDATKTVELLHTTYTRDVNLSVVQTVWRVYDLSGDLVLTVTDVFAYVGSYVSTRTRTVS